MDRRFPLAVVVLLCIAASGSAIMQGQATPRASLLVLSKHDHTLSIVDPATLKVVARAPVGPDPHEVIASSDGKTAYVSIYGGGRYHAISVIDLLAQKALPDIDTGALAGPHGLTFVGGKLWFTAEAAKAIARIDPATGKVDWIMGTGQDRTHMLYVTSDQKHIYTTNVNAATVSILDQVDRAPMGPPPGAPAGPNSLPMGPPPGGGPMPANWDQTVISVGKGDEGFDVSPDGRQLWTANAHDGTVSIIDLPSKKVIATLNPGTVSANRLKFTPDGRLVFIASLNGSDVVVISTSDHKVTKRIPIGHGAAGIEMQPDGTRAFVACTPDNYVSVIDLSSLTVVGHIDAGGEPDGMAWAVQQ